MGGFSDNYECGYWGDDTPPMQKNKALQKQRSSTILEKKYSIESHETHKVLKVMLTAEELLDEEELDTRINLCKTCSNETALELLFNEQTQTFDVYEEETYIGSIQTIFKKENIDNSPLVHDFCLKDKALKELEMLWSGEFFFLRVSS